MLGIASQITLQLIADKSKKRQAVTPEEELCLQDALGTNLLHLIGVQQALWHVRDDSSEYPMCHMLAEAMSNSIKAIAIAMPEEWRKEYLFF